MIDTSELEKRIKEIDGTEYGERPFNKWSDQTILEMFKESLKKVNYFNELVEKHRNELVLDWYEVVRLIDVIDGGDNDYYWCYENSKEKYQSSCVGSFTVLKGNLPDRKYNELVRVWNLNNGENAI